MNNLRFYCILVIIFEDLFSRYLWFAQKKGGKNLPNLMK